MIPFGTLFNVATVLIGSTIGLLFKKMISPELNKKVFFVMGLFTLVLGLSMSIKSSDFILMFLSLVFGTMYGEYCNLDKSITNFTEKIKTKINVKDAKFTDGIVTAFLLFCIGSMTIVGAIDEGLGKTPDILYTKSIMDGISSIILASAFGIGVLFSVFPMLIFQGGITILVFYYKEFLPVATKLLITEVALEIESPDAYFPVWKKEDWTEVSRRASQENGIRFDFVEYVRN